MKPPALADWLFKTLAPQHIRRDVLGDLHEEYTGFRNAAEHPIRARLWYWRQVLGTIAEYRFARGRHYAPRRERMRIGRLFEATAVDLRFAIRSLIKTPGFTAIAVATLALGIGANTTIFSVVQSVLLRPLPYDQPDRIVEIYETHAERGWNDMSFSHPNFWDLWEKNDSFEELAALAGDAMNLTGFENPERLSARRVSAGFFSMLRLEPLHGRTFAPGEDVPGADNRVALLGHGLWLRRFGGDPNVVGQTITLDDTPHTVIGVLPDEAPFPGQTDVYVPLVQQRDRNRSDHRLFVAGRLKPGVTAEAAEAELDAIAFAVGGDDEDGQLGVRFVASSTWMAGDQLRVALWVLMGAVGFLLMIACVNLTNLLLARATGRQRESAVCAALGATRGRLTSRALAESLVLGLVGAGCGVLLSLWGIGLVQRYNPGNIPRVTDIGINQWVLGFTLVAALVTGVITGLVPGLQMPYGNLLTMLRDGDRGVAGNRRQHRTRNVLVAAETALSLMLLVGAGLMIRSFGELQRVDTGFDSENRLSFQVNLPDTYRAEGQVTPFLQGFLSRVAEIPQVHAASAVSSRPISGGSTGMGIATVETMDDQDETTWVDWRLITPEHFRTMGLPLIRGRNFTDRDRIGDPWQAIISQPLAELLWPGEDPIGRRAALWVQPDQVAEIIGVVGGMRERGPQSDPTLMVYLPYYDSGWNPTFIVHTAGDPNLIIPMLRTTLGEMDENLPISNIITVDDLMVNSVAGNRFNMLLLGIFAGVALLLALAGIYGVLAYSVTRRTSEIGVRVALGASPDMVLRQIVGQGMRPVLLGIVIGVAGAVGLSRFLSTLLFDIAPTDPLTYGGVAALLAAAALVACYLPARRALSVDPKVALAAE